MQIHAVIRGRVQGVFFRAWTQKTARGLGLEGWVRNLRDGSVELLAVGEPDLLQDFMRLCWQGPPAARVEDISVDWSDTNTSFSDFSIQPSS